MTIFDYINDITVTKKGNLPLDEYVPYIVTRFLSFIDPSLALLLNEFNKQELLMDKQAHYRALLAIVPAFRRSPRIKYVKKQKEDKEKENPKIALLAQALEISQREAKLLLSVEE